MHQCGDFPPYRYGPLVCNETAKPFSYNRPSNASCVNWNQYYTNCTQRGANPFQGTISFDNIGLAWVAIFLVSFPNIPIQFVLVSCVKLLSNLLITGHFFGRLDRYNVLRTRRSQFLGLDLFRAPHRGTFFINFKIQ